MMAGDKEYPYQEASATCDDAYLWPPLLKEIQLIKRNGAGRAFDLGCGNGAIAGMIAGMGFDVTGIDTSTSGIAIAKANHPGCRFDVGSAYDDLANRYGHYPLVVSLEVVEHLYDPRMFARRLFDLVEPGGTAIVSTPYHGYLKNLTLALSGRLDNHFTALWDGGHIKFFSIPTLTQLLAEVGFESIRFVRVGRIPPLAKSMMAIAHRLHD